MLAWGEETNLTDSGKPSLIKVLGKKVYHDFPAPKKELTELAGLFIRREFPRKKILVLAGEKWDKVFYIHGGIIRLYYTDKEGREFNKNFFREDQLVWPVSPSARNNDSLFSIEAMEDIKVSICPFASFYSWLAGHGYWEKFALPHVEFFAEDKFLREYEFLMNSATKRFQNFCMENPELAERIPDYHLASYLGITNVSLSRIKKSADFNLC